MPRLLLVLCVALVVTSVVDAQKPYYHKVESLDWMAADSPVVVRAVVADFVHEADRSKQSTVWINVLETLKGPHKTTHTFHVPWLDREELLRWKTKKPEMLVFLVDSKRYSDQASMHRWTPRFAMNGQDKDNPNIHSPKEWGLIELAPKIRRPNGGLSAVYTLDMRDASDPMEVLAATRAAIAAAAKVKQARSHEFRWPRGLGNVDRKVPVDERLERLAHTWIESNNPAWRWEGARALAHFKSDENVASLKRLLKDNLALRHSRVKVEKQKFAVSFMEVFLSFPWGPANEDRHSRQQVSDAARASLTTLGIDVRIPELRPPPVVLCKAILDGPKEAVVDQEITFQLRIVNTSDRTTSKHDCLHVYAFSHDPWKLRTGQAIPLEPLAPLQVRNIPLKLTPVRMGTFDVRVFLEATLETEADIACAEVARAEIPVGYDPQATVQDLLLASPKLQPLTASLPATLAEVTEIYLQEAPANAVAADDVREHLARTIDRIKWFDQRKPDGFMQGLLSQRADLAGVPFALGDACRHKGEKRAAFVRTMDVLRETRRERGVSVEAFLKTAAKSKQGSSSELIQAQTAALMQTRAHEDAAEVVQYLAGIPGADATTALARFAIYSDEGAVHQAALTALRKRPAKDYADVLLKGLDYPWPAVAERASAAIAKLQRVDLIPQLIDVLDRPDPRAPRMRDNVPVVRELVRINHHRNCLLCHATGNLAGSEKSTDPHAVALSVAADVLIPNQGFPSTYYTNERSPDIFVRIDVTYLRQDFSLMLPVKDSYPWPESQRFDFVVRTRQLSEKDAQAYREKMPRGMSPYHLSAVRALRDLTGRNTEPTAPAWRKLLAL